MKPIIIKANDNQTATVFLAKRIDANIFACKSSLSKRKPDLLVHIDYILSNIENVAFDKPIYNISKTVSMFNQDELAGLIEAHKNGENPYKCTIMCANTTLNEVG